MERKKIEESVRLQACGMIKLIIASFIIGTGFFLFLLVIPKGVALYILTGFTLLFVAAQYYFEINSIGFYSCCIINFLLLAWPFEVLREKNLSATKWVTIAFFFILANIILVAVIILVQLYFFSGKVVVVPK